ncbi:unnamed protein product [Phytomonas sp. Hart1]|nr:unnamed protein product [Phytomonas sp. Hart1]|eukprot:CCW69786.1 unnamed protein product [Phytomonas sp. isolate Hart1]
MSIPIPPSVVPPPPTSVVPPPPTSVVPPPPTSVVPPPPTSVVPPPPTSVVPPPPTSVVPPPPTSVVPPPPTSVVPPPPTSVVPPPPTSVVPPPPTSVVPPPPTSVVPPPPTSVVPPPPPPTAFVPAPPLPMPLTAKQSPITVQAWENLESDAQKMVPNEEGTRYLEMDENIRDQVYKLFILSDYDIFKMLTNVTSSLHHIGRRDLGLMRNSDFTAFTILQSSAYGGAEADTSMNETERRRDLVSESITRINKAYTNSLAALNATISNLPPTSLPSKIEKRRTLGPKSISKTFPYQTTYERLMTEIAKMRVETNKAKRQSTSRTTAPTQRRAY